MRPYVQIRQLQANHLLAEPLSELPLPLHGGTLRLFAGAARHALAACFPRERELHNRYFRKLEATFPLSLEGG